MFNFLLTGIYNLIQAIISIFPTGTGFPSTVHDAFTTLGNYTGILDVFVPLSTLLFCLTLVFGVEIWLFSFKTIKYIISYIPFVKSNKY